ncbi:TatD family hydrolase [Undibacterium sp. TJN19]|uniref:TatD family hydrolase n=1 Tax=Undibacterium sp. TJN19 TaxID=3413055 RepID=UPI003BF04044
MIQKPSLIDIGANLTNRRFHADLDAVLDRAKTAGVTHIIVTGTSERASQDALTLARQHGAYLSCTAGVHPHEAKNWNAKVAKTIASLAVQKEVVAVGECGLDYNRMFSPEAEQLACFEAQLQLAVEIQKPVFLHERDAHDAFFALLKQYRPHLKGAVVHCFTGNTAQIREYLDLDCHIGITGWVCDERRGDDLRKAVRLLPKERLMIETDAPFLLPRNLAMRPDAGRNEPMYLATVLEAVAAILRVSPVSLTQQVQLNTQQFFGLTMK